MFYPDEQHLTKLFCAICYAGGEDDDDETNWVYSLNSAADGWQQEEDMVTGITETTVYSSYAVATIPD